MLGRWIDRAVLTALGTTGLYLYFLNAGFKIVVSVALSLLCLLLVRHTVRHYPGRLPYTREQAASALYAIAEMGEGEAAQALVALTNGADGFIIPLPRHPDTELSAGEVYALWQAHRDCEQIVLATSGGMGTAAAKLAATLNDPAVRVMDKQVLTGIIRRTGQYVPERPRRVPIKARLQSAFAGFSRRRASPRMIFTGVSLLGMYLLMGRGAYLVASMVTLFTAGALWINNGMRWRGPA